MQDILWPPRERRLYRHLLRTPGTGAPLISLIVRRLIAALRHRGPDCLRGAAFVFHARLSVPRRAYYSRKVRSLRAAACSRGQLHNKGETPRSSPRILRTLLAGQPPARRVERGAFILDWNAPCRLPRSLTTLDARNKGANLGTSRIKRQEGRLLASEKGRDDRTSKKKTKKSSRAKASRRSVHKCATEVWWERRIRTFALPPLSFCSFPRSAAVRTAWEYASGCSCLWRVRQSSSGAHRV